MLFKTKEENFEYEVTLEKNYPIFYGEKIFYADLIDKKQLPKTFPKGKNLEYIDFDETTGPLKLRNYRPGDRFNPLNMKGNKKVSDFFTDEKVPLHLRKQIPILTCPKGIIWIVGYQIDDRFKITYKSKTILKVEIREAKNGR